MADDDTGWVAASPGDPAVAPELRRLVEGKTQPPLLGEIQVLVHGLGRGDSEVRVRVTGVSEAALIDAAIAELHEARRYFALDATDDADEEPCG